jgi:hypothetical protein
MPQYEMGVARTIFWSELIKGPKVIWEVKIEREQNIETEVADLVTVRQDKCEQCDEVSDQMKNC